MTVRQYQLLNKIPPSITGTDLFVRKLSIMTGKSNDEIESRSFKKLEKLKAKLAKWQGIKPKKIKVLWIKGIPFTLRRSPREYSTEIYLSLKSFDRDRLGNLHKILAWIYKPLIPIEPQKTYDWFLEADMSQVQAAFFLFSRKWQKSKVHLEYSIQTAAQTLTNHQKELENWVTQYNSTTAGITP